MHALLGIPFPAGSAARSIQAENSAYLAAVPALGPPRAMDRTDSCELDPQHLGPAQPGPAAQGQETAASASAPGDRSRPGCRLHPVRLPAAHGALSHREAAGRVADSEQLAGTPAPAHRGTAAADTSGQGRKASPDPTSRGAADRGGQGRYARSALLLARRW